MPARKIYHVVPGRSAWTVKIGKAKRASAVRPTKVAAVKTASALAKSSPTAQVVLHEATGRIKGDRTYEYRDFRKKKKVRRAVSKTRKTKLRNRRKKYRITSEHRKAALLGVARLKRARYQRRKAAGKAGGKRRRPG